MSHEQMTPQIREQRWQLLKFDGDVPAPGELKEPAEIIEGGDGIETSITYRSGSGETIQLFTGNDTGHAVLAEERPRGDQ